MLVSYEWLKKYVDINVSADELAEKLTLAGITVDLVHYPGAMLQGIIAGKIMQIDAHPDAEKLVVCQLYMGEEYKENLNEQGWLQIVTGAANVRVGQIVPVAVHGASVAEGKIKKSKLRGVPSFGMMCSKEELNVQSALTDEYGIWILDGEGIEPGDDCISKLWLNDPVLELDLTPNRTDCLSIVNLAREVAAVLGTELHLPEIAYQEGERNIADLSSIEVRDTDLCLRYIGRMIEDLQIGASPYWLQHCLGAAGIRSISNVVDISNFVMLEYGCPMHTFDYDTLQGGGIIVRRAGAGEQIVTLDEQTRELTNDNLLICDAADRAICVAGVMGGLNTEITAATSTVFLEVACFDHVSIRRTSRALGLHSEASQRYEKGVNAALLDTVSRRTIQLLAEYCGGKPVAGCIDCNNYEEKQVVVRLRPERVNAVLGTDFSDEEIAAAIGSLQFGMKRDGDAWLVDIPNYRVDITLEVDLIEEVARLLGFDRIPTSLPYGSMTEGKRTPKQRFLEDVKNELVQLGANEIITYGFIGPREWEAMNLPEDSALRDTVRILNPLNEDQSIMRTTLLPGILRVASRNVNRRNSDLLLFESGAVFIPKGDELPDEINTLAVLATGKTPASWAAPGAEYDYFWLKGLVEALLQRFRVADVEFCALGELSYMHPGRTAALYVGGVYAGYLGELHPQVQRNYEMKQRALVLEINLDVLFEHISGVAQYQSLPKFPAAVRDIALVIGKQVSAAAVEQAIRGAGGEHLWDIQLFDVYESEALGADRRSLAYNLTFLCPERTLTVEEVNAAFEDILAAVRGLGGELRS